MGGKATQDQRKKWHDKMILEGRCTQCGHKPDYDAGDEALDHNLCNPCRFKFLNRQRIYNENVRMPKYYADKKRKH